MIGCLQRQRLREESLTIVDLISFPMYDQSKLVRLEFATMYPKQHITHDLCMNSAGYSISSYSQWRSQRIGKKTHQSEGSLRGDRGMMVTT